jgi:hypothetical protein
MAERFRGARIVGAPKVESHGAGCGKDQPKQREKEATAWRQMPAAQKWRNCEVL